MSLLSGLTSSTSVLLFGPPPPVQRDIPPPAKHSTTSMIASHPASPATIKEALLRPNLGLTDKMSAGQTALKDRESPLPTPPDEQGSTAASVLLNTGASALGLLGTAVVVIGSAAVSALIHTPAEAEVKSGDPAVAPTAETASEPTVLASISNALFTTASSLASTAITSISNAATTDNTATSSEAPSKIEDPPNHNAVRRSSTLPTQYTASGEPFSSNPSISAMQRIPDHPCAHRDLHTLHHCCSAPDVLTLHDETKRDAGQSGHFHRVQQVVKGTKRVVKDIKNVL